jgi:hypothetical protein
MTTITSYRSGRIERIAATIGTALVSWAQEREHAAVDRDEHTRRRLVDAATREREQRALRRLLG